VHSQHHKNAGKVDLLSVFKKVLGNIRIMRLKASKKAVKTAISVLFSL
jgi:hypothetical protein